MKIIPVIVLGTLPVFISHSATNETEADTHEQHHAMEGEEMKESDHTMHMRGMYGPYPMAREASGTAWQPDASPMGGIHLMPDDWMFMIHGSAYGIYDRQGGGRGNDKFLSANMAMVMAQHPLGPGTFGLRTMLTLEPLTIGTEGYPLLLQTGETANGVTPLIDRQHPTAIRRFRSSCSCAQNYKNTSAVESSQGF